MAASSTRSGLTSARQSGTTPVHRAGGSRIRLHGAHGRSTRITRSFGPRGAYRRGSDGPNTATIGVPTAAATCIGGGERAELHILVPHAGAAKHSLGISHLAVTREREVVVVDVEDRPGVLADLTRRIAKAGVDLDLVYVATRNRVVFGAPDLHALKAALAV